MKKNNLDEMQEQALLKIEHNGCWLAFWGLLAAILIQGMLGVSGEAVWGEWIVFMVLALYLSAACLRKGIWDRRLKANWKTNLVTSILAGAVVGIFTAVRFAGNASNTLDILLIGAIPAVFTFALGYAVLSVCAGLYKNRRKKLDEE